MKHLILILLTALGLQANEALAQKKSEAESAQRSNCTIVTDSKYSGQKAVQMTQENARLTFTFTLDEHQKYTVFVAGDGIGGAKQVNCSVNGTNCAFQLNSYGEVEVGTYFFKQGENTVDITPNWTWYDVDYLRIQPYSDTLVFDIPQSPVDAQATDEARAMYAFLLQNFGKRTISGIMTGDMASANGNVEEHADVKAVYDASGKYPALVGFDMMNATGSEASNSWNQSYTRSSILLAKDTYRKGGFPAFTWHWRDPSRKTNEFYTSGTSVKISDALKSDGSWDTTSSLYKNLIRDIDVVANRFLELQRAGMACIFRPLHEASGGWFWWGREGAEPFKKLYRLMYDEMVNVKGVHNVIWVWNAADKDSLWNPGEEYYDIVSADIYNADFDYSSNYPSFGHLKQLTKGKRIIALSENGPIPDIQACVDEEAVWSWWMPWYQTWNGGFVDKTAKEEWAKCMNDPRIVTLDDMAAGWESYSAIYLPEGLPETHRIITDLQGRMLPDEPQHGFYIVNQKKLFRK